MRTYFGDSSLSVHYIQQKLNETFNNSVIVSGDYYDTFDMNYGFPHYIVKWLDANFPILDSATKEAYQNNDGSSTRSITLPISISNYFMCSNTGKRLNFTPTDTPDEFESIVSNQMYRNLYNKYMVVYNDTESISQRYIPKYKKYMNNNDLPIFIELNNAEYTVNTNTIFTLDDWNINKQVLELDDLVASYLLGRTIGPNSSMEDIYYAQRLLIRNREITDAEKGIWCLPNEENGMFDMTRTVIDFQTQRVDSRNTIPLFVTGYFDIFTEGIALKEAGEDVNGIFGL